MPGTSLDRRRVSKVHVPKCDFILVFIFEVLAPKTLNFTVFTDRTNYYRKCSHKLHDKKMNILQHLCFLNLQQEIFRLKNMPKVPKKIPQNVPNAGRKEGVPSEADMSQFLMSQITQGGGCSAIFVTMSQSLLFFKAFLI